jgi:hypothetical protein
MTVAGSGGGGRRRRGGGRRVEVERPAGLGHGHDGSMVALPVLVWTVDGSEQAEARSDGIFCMYAAATRVRVRTCTRCGDGVGTTTLAMERQG